MNYDHIGEREAIAGMSGTGKTTFGISLFVRSKAKYKFAFDRKRELARKLKGRTCINDKQMLYCVKRRIPVYFDSAVMFPGNPQEGFIFFCRWTYEICKHLQGTKLLFCDEIQFVVPIEQRNIDLAIKEILDDGRKEEIDCIFVVNKGYNKLHNEIRAQLTRLYIFRTTDSTPLKKLSADGVSDVDIEKVKNLAMPDKIKKRGGEYIIREIA